MYDILWWQPLDGHSVPLRWSRTYTIFTSAPGLPDFLILILGFTYAHSC